MADTKKKEIKYKNYKDEHKADIRASIDEMLKVLPKFCRDYYSVKDTLSPSTHLQYLVCIQQYLNYLKDTGISYWDKPLAEYTVEDLQNLTVNDAREYKDYLRDKGCTNTTINNNRSALSSYWTFFCLECGLTINPWLGVPRYKQPTKDVVHIRTNDERNRFLSAAEYGDAMSKQQLISREKTGIRDFAIVRLLLSTGMRVSELVGLDVKDVDLKTCSCHIITKGDKDVWVYFSDECKEVLEEYLIYRDSLHLPADNTALFVSCFGKNPYSRLSVRSVELLVKKYASLAGIDGVKITPHRLRATKAMRVLNGDEETGEGALGIEVVKEMLNHSSIQSTQVYARSAKSRIRKERNKE